MNFDDTTPDLFFATLYRDYLAHADSITAGVPADATLPKNAMGENITHNPPVLLLAAMEQDGSTTARKTILLNVRLRTIVKAATGGASVGTHTTEEAARTWCRAIAARLQDWDAFRTWLTAEDSARLDGWAYLNQPIVTTSPPKRNENHGIDYDITLDFHVAAARVL